jgi:hypothetical protein
MEEIRPNFWKSALYWGVISGVVSIILSVLMYVIGFTPSSFGRIGLAILMSLIILVVVLVIALKSYRNSLGGSMTYGQAFKFGFFVILFGSVISSIYYFLFLKFIDPEYLKNVMEKFMTNLEEFLLKRGMNEEQVSKAMEEAAKKPIPSPLKSTIQGFFQGLIFSTIVNLIVAAIMKKNPEIIFNDKETLEETN